MRVCLKPLCGFTAVSLRFQSGYNGGDLDQAGKG